MCSPGVGERFCRMLWNVCPRRNANPDMLNVDSATWRLLRDVYRPHNEWRAPGGDSITQTPGASGRAFFVFVFGFLFSKKKKKGNEKEEMKETTCRDQFERTQREPRCGLRPPLGTQKNGPARSCGASVCLGSRRKRDTGALGTCTHALRAWRRTG